MPSIFAFCAVSVSCSGIRAVYHAYSDVRSINVGDEVEDCKHRHKADVDLYFISMDALANECDRVLPCESRASSALPCS
jgi:hypothetical protein